MLYTSLKEMNFPPKDVHLDVLVRQYIPIHKASEPFVPLQLEDSRTDPLGIK